MATRWVKSLHCKSSAVDDVIYVPASSSSKKPLLSIASCADSSSHAVNDAVKYPSTSSTSLPSKPRPKTRPKQKPKPRPARPPSSPSPVAACAGPFPTLAKLPAGHSSRRVVEIIFTSSWSSDGGGSGSGSGSAASFPGEIEMLFRVRNPARTVARFEEHRAKVRGRADDDARCAADGNEMLRFHCVGGGAGVYDAGVASGAVWTAGRKLEGIRTFAGSGGAHASGGGGSGRKAMLVCRVIVGRVRVDWELESDADSVSLGKGELVVLDSRAVLPCFLIIYKI